MELTKEFVMNCRNVGVLRDFLCQAIDQVDALTEEVKKLNAKLDEKDKDIAKCELKIRRLSRALFNACANWAHAEFMWASLVDFNCPENWDEMDRKCRAKAEEYK